MSKREPNFENARQGAVVPAPPGKTRITIRIDTDILDWFREQVHQAGGGNYQTLVNDALRDHVRHQEGMLEHMLRKVVREELEAHSRS